jgi:hypothetical protein
MSAYAQVPQIHGLWSGEVKGNAKGTAFFTFTQRCSQMEAEYVQHSAAGKWARQIVGKWDPNCKCFRFHDDKMLSEQPAQGWVFCSIEVYELSLSEDLQTLSGFYDSEACNDHASISLRRVVQ